MQNWPALKIVSTPLESLTPYENNARTHSAEQIKQIIDSISEWGWTVPILADETGKIIAGHGRYMAALEMGLSQVPVITAKGWTDQQKRAYVIADNKLSLNAGWEESTLRLELEALGAHEFDLALLGFDDSELQALRFDNDSAAEMPNLPEGDKGEYSQKTFSLHNSQMELVEQAIERAKEMGGGESTINENGNGNALAFICGQWLGQY